MIKIIKRKDFDQYCSEFIIDVKHYLKWKKVKENNNFLLIRTYSEEINKNLLLKKRKKIRNNNKETLYINKIINLVNILSKTKYIVQHECQEYYWFNFYQKSFLNNSLISRFIYLRKIKKYIKSKFNSFAFSKFIDSFLISEEIDQFIAFFFKYSFILKKSDLLCISLDLPLIIELTHDLYINFITIDKKLFDKINIYCKENQIEHSVYNPESDFIKKIINLNNKYNSID